MLCKQEPEKWDQFRGIRIGSEAVLPNEVANITRYRYTQDDGEIYAQRWQQTLDFVKKHLLDAQTKQKT